MSDADKAELRSVLRARRRALRDALPDAAAQAAAHYSALGRAVPRVAAVYRATGAELSPEPLAEVLAAAGATIALPAVTERHAPVVFRQVPEAELVPDLLGIHAPPPDSPVVIPDLVVVPMLAFDPTGARLGQGGGFYDRTLAALRAAAPVFALGLAYAGQEVESLPMGPYDQKLDAVLTERGLTLFNPEF